MKHIKLIILLFISTVAMGQQCYDFSCDPSPLGIGIGYYYDQGYNLAAVEYQGITLIGSMYKAGVVVRRRVGSIYLEGEGLYKFKNVSVLGIADDGIKANSHTLRASTYYVLNVQEDFNPMVGVSVQDYADETVALPEIGLLATFPHFKVIAGVSRKTLRTRIMIQL